MSIANYIISLLEEVINERNIANLFYDNKFMTIDAYIETLINERLVREEQHKNWLKRNLKNYLLKEYALTPSYQPKPTDPAWMQGKEDLLTVKIDEDFHDTLLTIIDFMIQNPDLRVERATYPQMLTKALDWHKELAKKEKTKGVPTTDEVIMEFKDGSKLYRLSSKSLKAEGENMGICVGGSNYCQGVDDGDLTILSLRDKNNESQATLEVSGVWKGIK